MWRNALVVGATLFALCGPATADTVYYINDSYQPSLSLYAIEGTITTDGKVGVLTMADITAWSVTIFSTTSPPFLLSGPGGASNVQVLGTSLTATPTNLFWNFGNASQDLFSIATNANGGSDFTVDRTIGSLTTRKDFLSCGGPLCALRGIIAVRS
jgi:hypothetical protein